MCFSLTACSNEKANSVKDSDAVSKNEASTDTQKESGEKAPTIAAPTEVVDEIKTMTMSEFDSLLLDLPVSVIDTKYVVQDDKYKSLYPDMLQAILKNNTNSDIKNAVVGYVAWDKNNLPVKITGDMDFVGGSYVKKVNFADINLVPGGTYGDSSGYSIDEASGIASFKAVVVSYETFDGVTWENPYFDEFISLYEDKKLADTLEVDVTLEDIVIEEGNSEPAQSNASITESELAEIIQKQELAITKTEYVIQDEKYKSLYPDLLQAIIKNNTDKDIKNAVVAFVAWDNNNLPVKIKGSIDFTEGTYIKKVNYSDINLIPDATFGDSSGFEISEGNGVATVKAIVVSYETFEGETWENPYFKDFSELYEGKKLNK